MIHRSFLSPPQRTDLLKVARCRTEFHGAGVRANALILLDKGWNCTQIGEALLLDDDTIREFYKRYMEGGLDHLITYDWKGRPPQLYRAQEEQLSVWIEAEFPRDTTPIIAYILVHFGVHYSHSGCLSLLHRLKFTYVRPKYVPQVADIERQKAFIATYEALLNGLEADETVLFADAVHPEHQSRPAFGWAKAGEKIAIKSNSGRQRINIHGAIALETGQFIAKMVDRVNAQSSFELFEDIEKAYPQARLIHIFLDNAGYHHAKMLQPWLKRADCRIKLHFLPPYCPHLNPIERLWGVMHKNVTHNKSYQRFKDFSEAIDQFFKQKLPQNWNVWRDIISDNFRVIKLDDFRVLK